jgi:predicted metal-dependent phosphoesterase TrpH
MAKPIIDLQIHTTATPHHSSWAPEQLAQHAAQEEMLAIAATDHNTTGSVKSLLEAGKRFGVNVISGVEIDSGFNGKLWHTLIYGADPEAPELLALCDSVFSSNADDAQRLIAELPRAGWKLEGLDNLGRSPNVADVGTALARSNELPGRVAGEDDESAGMRYLLTQVPNAYNPPNVADIITLGHKLGALVVLAHPGRSKGIYAIPATEADIGALADAGLDGIEVFYPVHSQEQRAFYKAMAEKYSLLITGGSDSHHPNQALARWPASDCAAFLERFGISTS